VVDRLTLELSIVNAATALLLSIDSFVHSQYQIPARDLFPDSAADVSDAAWRWFV
jgi:hypothetical protein